MSILGNPRWPPKLLQISINGHNFGSREDSLMKMVAKYRFSCMKNSIRYIRMTSVMSKWQNPNGHQNMLQQISKTVITLLLR